MKSFLLHDGYDHLYNFQLILHLFVCEKCIQDKVIMKTVAKICLALRITILKSGLNYKFLSLNRVTTYFKPN